jgi:phosphatidylglycerol---prolipoprotein diacylglyceryl transferase
MYPVLFSFGPFTLHTYGLLVAIGFLTGVRIARWGATRDQLNVDRMMDLVFWSLVVGFIGARTLFVITRFESFMMSPLDVFKVWEGGLVFYGGPFAVIPFMWWYTRKHRMNLWKVFDVGSLSLVIGHFFGRLGCVGAGCCYGKPTGSDWFGLRFNSSLVEESLRGVLLHPTQLYEATGLLILLFALILVFKKKIVDGQVAITYLMTYPILRSIVEVYRGDTIRGFVIEDVLSTSQFISILAFVMGGAFLWLRLRSQSRAR